MFIPSDSKCYLPSIRKKCVNTQKKQIKIARIKYRQYLCTRKKCVNTQKKQII